MGTSEKVLKVVAKHAGGIGLLTREIAEKVNPPGVKDIMIATRSALQRLRRAGKVKQGDDGRWLPVAA